MTKDDVVGLLEFLSEQEHIKADGIIPCDTEIALGMAIDALRQPEIVRCKDCKYETDQSTATKWLPCMDMGRDGNWFCADGERKDKSH